MKTRDEAVNYLYGAEERFALKALPIFEANNWKWSIGADYIVPNLQDIMGTVSTLIWHCIESGGQNCTKTGRIQVFIRKTDRGEWISGIELVPVSECSY